MDSVPDLRNNERIKHKTDILVENYFSGAHHKAKMYNYSIGGLYFEADYAPLPGTEIYIGIKNSPYDSGADLYHARIRWRKQLKSVVSDRHFGVGVQFCRPIDK
jgi:hypothetical protein